MLLQFNLLVFDEAQGHWIKRRSAVTRNYLCGWFALDIASIAPSTADYIALFGDSSGEDGGGSSSTTRIFRIIRAVRLLKLLRLLRSSRVLNRILSRFAIPYRTLTLAKLFILLLVASHWVACSLGIIAAFSEQQRLDTWLGAWG